MEHPVVAAAYSDTAATTRTGLLDSSSSCSGRTEEPTDPIFFFLILPNTYVFCRKCLVQHLSGKIHMFIAFFRGYFLTFELTSPGKSAWRTKEESSQNLQVGLKMTVWLVAFNG